MDIVENRYVGMKSRGVYETPGGTILKAAHRAVEQITMDREVMHLRDELMPRYAALVYNGYWFSPEREVLQTLIDAIAEERDRGRAGSSSTRATASLRAGDRRTRSTTPR
ncbi:MAG: argininosuccinate synthase [Desulfobacterales bacterium]|nr:argininosuccinate synthase [Desulfobacterales bacterium]